MKKIAFLVLGSVLAINFSLAEDLVEIKESCSIDYRLSSTQVEQMESVGIFLEKNKMVIAQKTPSPLTQSVVLAKIEDIITNIDATLCKARDTQGDYIEYLYYNYNSFLTDINDLVQTFVGIRTNESAFNNTKIDYEANQAMLKLQNQLFTLVTLSQPTDGIIQVKDNMDLSFSFNDPEQDSSISMSFQGDTDKISDYTKNEFGTTVDFDTTIEVNNTSEKTNVKAGVKGNVELLSLEDIYVKINEFTPTLSVQGEEDTGLAEMQASIQQQINLIKEKYLEFPIEEKIDVSAIIKAIKTVPVFTFSHQEGTTAYGIFNPAWCEYNVSDREKTNCKMDYVDTMIGTNGKGYVFINKKGGQNYEMGITPKFIKADASVDELEINEHLVDKPIMQRNDIGLTKVALPADAEGKNGLRYTANEGLHIAYTDEMSTVSIKGPWTPTAINLKGDFSFDDMMETNGGEKVAGNMSFSAENINGNTKGSVSVDVKRGTQQLFNLLFKGSGTIKQIPSSPLKKPEDAIPGESILGVMFGVMSLID